MQIADRLIERILGFAYLRLYSGDIGGNSSDLSSVCELAFWISPSWAVSFSCLSCLQTLVSQFLRKLVGVLLGGNVRLVSGLVGAAWLRMRRSDRSVRGG